MGMTLAIKPGKPRRRLALWVALALCLIGLAACKTMSTLPPPAPTLASPPKIATPTPRATAPVAEFPHVAPWLAALEAGGPLDAALWPAMTAGFITDTLAYLDAAIAPDMPLDQQMPALLRMAEALPGSPGGQVLAVDLDAAIAAELLIIPTLNGGPLLYARYDAGGWQATPLPLPLPDYLLLPDVLANLFPGPAEARDVTGDGLAEALVSYTFVGGSGKREYIQALRWDGVAFIRLFQAELVSWAGESHYALEPDPTQTGKLQIILTYPHLYDLGFDHAQLNHPVGQQLWRWDAAAGRFVFAETSVDFDRSAWGADIPITSEDRLRWLVNEGETRFRQGDYVNALDWYDQARALAAAESWTPAGGAPHWAAYADFRRAESLLLLGRAAEGRPAMQAVADAWPDDLLGDLARAFLAGYGAGGEGAVERGVAALAAIPLDDHFYHEQGGALRSPMDAAGIRFSGVAPALPAPEWPSVGAFEAP